MVSTGDPPPLRDSLPTLQDIDVSETGAPRATSQHPPDRGVLVQTSGLETGRVVTLASFPVTLGTSAECSAPIDDRAAAPVQARIVRAGDDWVVEDVGGGTLLDDVPTARGALTPGAHVRFASVSFRFQLVDANEEAALSALYAASTRDGLTGLGNRAHLLASLASDVGYAGRRDEPLAIAVLDVVEMRALVARHGHASADEVLKRVAERARIAAGDAPLFRSGGDELTLIARKEGATAAARIAERIATSVAATPFSVGPAADAVAVTLRVAAIERAGRETVAAFLARARALLPRGA